MEFFNKLLELICRSAASKGMVQGTVRKVAHEDLRVGLICADRDGNRIRIDRVDRDAGALAYHFLNDELRVQEGVQEVPIVQFIGEGWWVT